MALGSVVEAVVGSRDLAAAKRFAHEAFGLEALAEGDGWALLGVPGSPSGRLRLVAVAESSRPPAPAFWEAGPRLIGIYATDLERTERQVRAAGGWAGPVGTFDIGYPEPLEERLVRGADDLWWTVPDYEPRLPTPALEADPGRAHGELHSAVIVVEDADAALALFAGAGGMEVVFDGEVGGEEIEEMLGLPPGGSLRNIVLAGAGLPPARLELLEIHGTPPDPPRRRPVGLRRIVFEVADVAAETAALVAAGAAPLAGGVLEGPAGIEIELRSADRERVHR